MARLVYLDSARDDLGAIFRYIAEESRSAKTALSFVQQLQQKCRAIADTPMIGRTRPELRVNLRSFALRGYVIFYITLPNEVRIVNVLHGRRDIDGFFE